ncbi:uncharacterized protein LOC123509263 [Portunus trituberculatus]|uniref:uncharacterized protein LOC123509263 n=1 Tax=Portunus trituberculatus TaxID=210409 RepID=UPI001E1D121D|nr:uncharacterized protein LOC123509263 [Portunus trituberculatus]
MEIESKHKPTTTVKPEPHERHKEKPLGTYYSTESTEQNKLCKSYQPNGCRFCGQAHKASQCTQYKTGHDRIQRLLELKQCVRCMGKHLTRSCTVNLQTCRRCQKGPHHTTLCKSYDKQQCVSYPESKNDKVQSAKQQNPGNDSVPVSSAGHSDVTTGAATIRPTSIALATAKARLESDSEYIRIFFDSGSQRTFIARNFVQRKCISVKARERMTLTGFTGQAQSQKYDIVKPVLQMGNRKKRVTAVVVDTLPDTIVTVGLSNVIDHLTSKGMNMADTEVNDDKVGHIDILIGADHYYDFISTTTAVVDGIHLLSSPAGYT